ncbi:reverse transcriptase family protein [Pseudoduganella aquatica]|uniref:RNA-directed DNA polymerase n=1 Tax=Pseudoduganella aquatica TaxID=2660641 RepID=A0A7X4HEU8_9BURK|nr:reverse transcriptase family protein [Pseudoduganella aquatica]MYN09966.1 RNA-directed DNA polymerase [Pseudoduganella aquatica]
MNIKQHTVLALADMALATDGSLASLTAACHRVFDAEPPWVSAVCEALIARTGEHFHYYSRHELAGLLLECIGHGRGGPGADGQDGDDAEDFALPEPIALPAVRRYCVDPPVRPPKPEWLAALALPELANAAALAAWLNEPVGALDWFADQWRLARDGQSPLQHYHYRWVPKRSGGVRLIEIPKARLRRIQQKILREILDLVPPHPAAHGFRRGHSCVTHAAQHAGQHAVVRMDLKDFFPSIQLSRVHALFEKLGYPYKTAGTLARICVNRTPLGAFRSTPDGDSLSWSERQALKSPHLPQGSPCSPALANLCAYRLDIRLAALAESLGGAYSRYADDLAFSGGPAFARAADRFHIQVAAIALEEGFRVNTRKTRLMRAGARQQVTGVVVNAHPNIARDEYDKLKATLTNCVRHGPASQNRDRRPDFHAYLAGRISYVKMVNAARASRLQSLMDAIAWAA